MKDKVSVKLSNIILVVLILFLITFIVVFSINYLESNKTIIKSGKEKEQSSKSLALMLETGLSSGEYQVSTDSTWPSTGYEFNSTLSKCENGSTLTYDIVTKKVKVQSNKSDKCFVYFDKEYMEPVIHSITESNVTTSTITITANATAGTNAIKTYYYSKDNGGSYVTSTSNSFTFSGLTQNTQYNVKIKVEDVNGRFSQISGKSITTLLANLAQTLKNNYSSLGMDYHNGLANGVNDGSYRFSGANPNNYVCFGPGATATGTACPEENQYRIIGVFGNQVKLIKKISLGKKAWNLNNVNIWSASTMYIYLNLEYLNSLTPTWSNKIASNIWQVGGLTAVHRNEVPSVAYAYEVGANKANVTFNGKIGLMYASDYGFAASNDFWTKQLYFYNTSKASDWLNINVTEWTISCISDINEAVLYVDSSGVLSHSYPKTTYDVRPSFYLEPSINLNGGNGTSADPYRIS